MKSAEQILNESSIYITKQGSQIRIKGGRIKVFDIENEEEIGSYPIKKIDTINVFGNINFTTPFITKASSNGITLNYFTQHGKYKGSFIPKKNTIARIRREQYNLSDKQKLKISKSIIEGKIRNSITLLKRKKITPPNKLEEIIDSIKKISEINLLRSYEGQAADLYFNKLDEALIDRWEFKKRSKNPPKNHINSLFSLTYTMIKNEVITSLRQYNLDPFLGIMHVDRYGRPALALDMMEELRPIFSDAFSIRLINRQTLTHDSFKQNNHLKEREFKKYLKKFEKYMKEKITHPHFGYKVTRRKSTRMQAILLRKTITGEMNKYHPLIFKK
ncbi:CRISPR-associated endonuclease Cas1 [Methanonatronarchaeum sp. AMET-Sl]|nr:CRISPR-associated endonuclease Cas1 [Methanonatronarchaeum sp. AMET-Sl]WGI17880.1 CRISPR-associated endonuclease Cas1 [Methanonatronarchaeum sp. AMET-Sl]